MQGAHAVKVDGWTTHENTRKVSVEIWTNGGENLKVRLILDAGEAVRLAAELKDRAGH